MPSASQLLVLRLRSGGVLVVAPATVLPWPRVVARKLRRLQEFGVRMALADPQAVTRLRRELPRLLNYPVTRGALPDDDSALAALVITGARTGELTLMYGHAETSLRTGDLHDLATRYAGRPEVAAREGSVREGTLDAGGALPGGQTPLPASADDRLRWVCERTPRRLPPELEIPMREFFAPAVLPLTSSLLAIWSGAQETDAGFNVDAGMFAAATGELGTDASLAFEALADAFDLVQGASHWGDLDKAAGRLAVAVSTLRPALFRQFLRRIGDRNGGTS